jgi:hypothetical protein
MLPTKEEEDSRNRSSFYWFIVQWLYTDADVVVNGSRSFLPFSLPAWVAPELNNETDSATAAAAGGALCAMPGARAPCMQP